MPMELNSREAALLLWLGIIIVAIFAAKSTRASAVAVVRAFLVPKVGEVVILAAAYVVATVWLLSIIGFWDLRNLKTTLFWFAGTGFAMLMDVHALQKGALTLKKIARDAFAVSAVVVFLGGLATFPFWAELILLPALTMIATMAAFAETQEEHRIVVCPLSAILSCAGLGILIYSVAQAAIEWHSFYGRHQAREFALPILLTLLFLPFLYLFMLAMAYESAAIGLKFRMENRAMRRHIWLRGIAAFGLSLEMFKRYVQAITLHAPTSAAEVGRIIGELRRTRKRERNPPEVGWEHGWSPFAAQDFLIEFGLRPGPYHRSFEDWWAESPSLKINTNLFPDRLVYRLFGTEQAVARLSLGLDVGSPDTPEQADELFRAAATQLVLQALGYETASRFVETTQGTLVTTLRTGAFEISIERDDWGTGTRSSYSRRLNIYHPAYPGSRDTYD